MFALSFQAFVATGTNLQLVFNPVMNGYNVPDLGRECDFDKEMGKVGTILINFLHFEGM
jgi:Core binding factor beta subunit